MLPHEQLAIVLLGLVFGSFLNVIIYRVPRDKSIIYPGSSCPLCSQKIPLYRNIPILSFILQLGRCAQCKGHISFRYPLVEALSALLWVGSFYKFSSVDIIFSIWISSCVLSIIFIDFDKFIIPLQLIFVGLVVLPAQYFFSENYEISTTILGLVVGVGYLGLIFILTSTLTGKQTLGYGDLFLIALLGSWLGPTQILAVIFFAAIAALAGWGIIGIISGNFDRNRRLPFGSFLGIVALIYHFFQPAILPILELNNY